MMKSYLILCCLVLITCKSVNGLKVHVKDRQLYKVIPKNDNQLQGLRRLESNSEVLSWSGLGEIGDPVEYLAVPKAMEKFREKLVPLNLTADVQFPQVEITMSTTGLDGEKAEPSSYNQADANLDPIRKIPGTDLYTGIWYVTRMPRFPEGFVTWTEEITNELAHFVQISLKPENLPHYKEGGKWHNDVQWRFGATEDPNYYTWDNRFLSANKSAITTWSFKEVQNGYHIIASTKPEDVGFLSPDGKWRIHSLWKPVRAGGNNYQLVNKNFPQGTITWTEKKYRDYSHYIQVDIKAENQKGYAPGGGRFNDTLFCFEPAEVQTTATISNFVFETVPEKLL